MRDKDKTKEQLIAENEELRQRVATLEASERRFRTVIDTVPLTIGEINRDGVVVFTNAATEKMYGYTPEELIGSSAWDRIEEGPSREAFRAWFSHAMSEQPPLRPVFGSRVKKNGERIDIRGDCNYLRNEAGEVTGLVTVVADITDLKQAEEELAKSKAVLQAAIECLPFTFFAIGLDGRYMLQNAVSKAHVGGDAIGKLPEEVCPNKDDLAIWLDNNRRAFAGERVEGEVALSPGGEERFYYNIIAPIRDGEELYGILGVNIDITEKRRAEEALQKAHSELEQRVKERTAELAKANERLQHEVEERRRADEALRQSELRFRNYFEQGLIGMAVTSVDKRWLEVNDRLCEIVGYSREELRQKNWAELTHPDDLAENQRLFTRLLSGETEKFIFNKRYLKQDGSIVYTTIYTRAFRMDDGTIDHIVVLVEDITARKQAENRLAYLASFPEGNPNPVVEVGLGGDIQYVNPAAHCLFPNLRELGLSHPWLSDWEATVRPFCEGRTNAIVRSVTVADRTYRQSFHYIDQDQVVRIYSLDVTELKRAEEALERERQSLWRMLQASDHERQTISYEIHDGLAQYLAAAGMHFQAYDSLRDNSPSEAEKAYETALELVRQAHAESRRLINEVRLPVIDETGLETAISHLVHEQRRHGGPKIKFDSDVQFDRLPSILENAIYRIVQESLTNACKHSKSKKLTVTMTQEEQEVRLEVRDWGIGFDTESVKEGHFGLEGIRQRVRLLGGRLTIESTPGSGTLIQVVVPILEKPSKD